MKCEVIKTKNGYRIYGAFTIMMDVDSAGNVTYSNLNSDCGSYQDMYAAYLKAVK